MDIRRSFIYTAVPTALMYSSIRWFIPYLHASFGFPLIVCWFISASVIALIPMTILSLVLYRKEGNTWDMNSFITRFRLTKPSAKTIAISLFGIFAVGIATAIVMKICEAVIPNFSANPAFMRMSALQPGKYWILLAWLPMFLFNIIGEGFYWRGFMFPKQEEAFGNKTWIIHGACWLTFHIPFGINLLITLLPIIFITSYLVQKTKSTWTDIIIHSVINGSGFLLIAFGIIS